MNNKKKSGTDPDMAAHHEQVKNEYLWRCGLVALEAAIGQLATLAPDMGTVVEVLESEIVLLREYE